MRMATLCSLPQLRWLRSGSRNAIRHARTFQVFAMTESEKVFYF